MFIFCFDIERKKLIYNHEYKETDSLNSVQSSLKYYLLWVTLYSVHTHPHPPMYYINTIPTLFFILAWEPSAA